MDTVLITDGNQRKALVAARALGAAGWRVLVAEETAWQMTRFSRYVAGALKSPSPRDTARYAAWLVETAGRESLDLVLPMDDGSTAAAVQIAAQAAAQAAQTPAQAAAQVAAQTPAQRPGQAMAQWQSRLLVPTPKQWAVASDKACTLELAGSAGVPAPPGGVAPDLATARALAAEVGYPVVVRARRESGGRGLAFVSDPADLPTAFQRIRARDPAPLVQRQVPPGTLWDVCLLYDRTSTVRAAFVQRELRHFPLRGGTSTLQESAWRPDLVDLAIRLLAPLGWTGPVEVEFMADAESGQIWLMEINPRFWASLALAVQCGVNFPLLVATLARGGSVPPVRLPGISGHPTEHPSYPSGRRCRWLLPGDLLHYLANPERKRMAPSFWRTYDHRTRDDIWSADDPAPVLGFTVAALGQIFSPAAWRMLMRW